jgi:molybdenum cofactor cytidylyltransferase
MTEVGKVAVVILAAGNSSRMGSPKQLLPVNGKPLLQKPVEAALRLVSVGKGKTATTVIVFVVLGAYIDEIKSQIDFGSCQVLINENWQSGMSSSITLALTHIQINEPEVAGVLLVMGDQPYVTDTVLSEIIAKFEQTGAAIVVSSFCAKGTDEKIPGPPAFFAKELFPELLQLEGDAGARKVVLAHADQVVAIDFPLGAIDIDSDSDYAVLLQAL